MERFYIENTDPNPFKDKILKWWSEFLPGTAEKRFEWLIHGNPTGSTLWYTAFSKKDNELIGIVSITPKEFYYKGTKVKGGILGDFMIDKNYRVFGPAVLLIRQVINNISKYGFDFLYTIPNNDSKKVLKRAGMKIEKKVECIGLPINYKYYFKKKLNGWPIGITSYICDQLIRFYCREPAIILSGIFEEFKSKENLFDMLWEKKKRMNTMTGDTSSAYMKWRYIDNPSKNFHIYTYRNVKNENIDGYVVFYQKDRKIEIYDIFAFNKNDILKIMKCIIKFARRSNCQAIYFSVEANCKIKKTVGRLLPFNMQHNYDILCVNNTKIDLVKQWDFVTGDRNL